MPTEQAAHEEHSVQVEATAQRASVGSPGLIVGVVGWNPSPVLIGCGGDLELFQIMTPTTLMGTESPTVWMIVLRALMNGPTTKLDHDRDGCHDGEEDDDDDNDTVPDEPTGGIDWLPTARKRITTQMAVMMP